MSSYNPLVSVIIPAYNHENYVQETIKSILTQTYERIELIIIDDGSQDSTWAKICEMDEACSERFCSYYRHLKPNSGTCDTLNRLLEKAHGEYVYLIASDDIAKPHTIEKQVSFLEQYADYALVVGDNAIIDNNEKQCYWDECRSNVYDEGSAVYKTFGAFLKQQKVGIDFLSPAFGSYESLVTGNYIPNGYLIRKSIFEQTGAFTPKAPLEDYWLMLQISKYAKMKYLDEVLYSYRWHENNTAAQSIKMRDYTEQTLIYEAELTKEIKYPSSVHSRVIFNEMLVRRIGLQGVCEIVKTNLGNISKKRVILFGLTVFESHKSRRFP